ncbi:MAG TPA: flagellar hook protein FlgE [Terriglobales bacterium]|nr:flagellar hook protein FlgE [Terriglobales bacterium]
MPMFSIPLSGLDAASNALSVIANNLANLNTVGYKDQSASFQDLFYQTIGSNGAGPIQVGAGATVSSISGLFTNGALTQTGVGSDVAITGNGFFVIQDANGALTFTRDGHFNVNAKGQLISDSGDFVMGYPAVNGVIVPGQTLAPIQLGQGQVSPPAVTSTMQMTANLDASADVGTVFSTPLTVYDSLGVSHVLTFNYTKTGPNAWSYEVTIPAADVGGTGNPVQVSTGNLTFSDTGILTSPTGNVTGITINNLASGAAPMNVTWNLYDVNNNPLMSQFATPSSTSATYQDGYGAGNLLGFSVNSDGTIQGTFSNGKTAAVAQIALASFANLQGLERIGGNQYAQTLTSGAATIGAPGSGGRGTLTGGTLEQSNVDIAKEFSKMIITQRGFQANARVVTTFDEITQDTINLKR